MVGWGQMCTEQPHDASTEMPAIPAVTSSAQINEDVDGRGEAVDAVDEGVGRNGNEEDEELGGDGDGDMVNQSHVTAPHERKMPSHKKQCRRKALPKLDWHLAAFVYKALDSEGCQHRVLDNLYGNRQISQCLGNINQIFPTDPITIECESPCCDCCVPHSTTMCCDICDPEHTASMYATDLAPKNKHRANKVKVDPKRLWMSLDGQLESKLKAFCEELYAEWWKDSEEDFFLGPQIFFNLDQIHDLCHLAHAKVLVMIDDLQNNFKWSWMEDYGSALLRVIHDVYKPEVLSPIINPDGAIIDPGTTNTSSLPSMHQPGTALSAPSNSLRVIKPWAKRGIGTQCCSACQLQGHNSEYHIYTWLPVHL